MSTIVLVIHVILAAALIGVILIQRSEGGGLGIGGGGGGMGSFMSGRGTANLLTRTTTILATGFMLTSVLLAIIANQQSKTQSLIEQIEQSNQQQPAESGEPTPGVPIAD